MSHDYALNIKNILLIIWLNLVWLNPKEEFAYIYYKDIFSK